MRQMISGLVAAAAVMAAAPAMACGYSPCGYSAPVASYGYSDCNSCGGGYGGGYGYAQLADPVQQYYYVNQGPTYSGPGAFAPSPTYQEAAVSGWNAYSRPYYYGYDGGRYADATNHYYDGAGFDGPAIYSYGARRHYRTWAPRTSYYHAPHYRSNYSYGPRYGYAPRHAYAPRYSSRYAPAPYHYGHRVLRRYY